MQSDLFQSANLLILLLIKTHLGASCQSQAKDPNAWHCLQDPAFVWIPPAYPASYEDHPFTFPLLPHHTGFFFSWISIFLQQYGHETTSLDSDNLPTHIISLLPLLLEFISPCCPLSGTLVWPSFCGYLFPKSLLHIYHSCKFAFICKTLINVHFRH